MTRILLLLFAALLCSPMLPAQDDLEARLDAVREFKTYMRKAREEALQVEAVMTLKGNECGPAAAALLELMDHRSPAVRKAAFAVLGTYRAKETFATWIEELPKIRDSGQVAVLIKVLGNSGVAEAVPAIEEVAGSKKAGVAVRYEAARALSAIGEAGETGLLGTLLQDKDASVRMAAVDAVGALRLREQSEVVVGLLTDAEWQVQSAAIGALGHLRPQSAVQPLIDLMKEGGRLKTECADALFLITTFDFGVDAARWQSQWDRLMAIEGWRIPTDEEVAKAKETRRKNDEYYGRKEERNSFVGIPTTSTNVLFIIDQSGSMDDLVLEVEKFQGYKNRHRFTIVQAELLNTIDTLTADTNFDIVAFATDLKVWKKRLVPANVVNRDSAKSFVSRLRPLGGSEAQELAAAGLGGAANLAAGKTNTLKALLYAFGIDPEQPPKDDLAGPGKDAMKRKIDTVYFLSDGRPSTGVIVDTNEILKEVRRYNASYRIVFHTIAIGDFQKSFLQQLAEENGGVFVDMGR